MIKIIILSVLIILAASKFQKPSHKYWYTASKKTASSGIPFGDVAWNYCDMKCLYLENYYPNTDFVVINFEEAAYKPNFAACYVRSPSGYSLWNTVASNKFFNENCGQDKEDYAASSDFKIISKEGEGRGTQLAY